MKLKALNRYTNGPRQIDVYPGDVIEVKDELGVFLQNDSPGTWEPLDAAPVREPDADQQPGDEARRQSSAILDEAQRLLEDAHDQANRTRAAVLDTGVPKPFDMPPDGTTLKADTIPPVITGPDSGVEIVHRADEAEQQVVVEEQQAAEQQPEADVTFTPSPIFEAQVQDKEEEEDEEQKGLDVPPRDKAVKRSPKRK